MQKFGLIYDSISNNEFLKQKNSVQFILNPILKEDIKLINKEQFIEKSLVLLNVNYINLFFIFLLIIELKFFRKKIDFKF